MPDGFVIMQIGDAELDHVFDTVIAPAITDAGLVPRRIDLDNSGGLLKSEIVEYLERSDIIVADLTNERPNCYLEVGYCMGLGRNRHLILTVRADHLPGDPAHTVGGPKVHFDLAGYDLLMWSPNDLAGFRRDLTTRILRRLAITRDTPLVGSETGEQAPPWMHDLRERGLSRIHEAVGPGHMEVAFGLTPPKVQRTARDLLEAVRTATISTFGWPIGLSLNTDDGRAKPTGNGISAEIIGTRWDREQSYDIWELRTDGDFFMVQSLFEDQRGQLDAIFVDTRIVRVTESILYCARLYERLEVPADAEVNFRLGHGGLRNRVLTSASPNRQLSMAYRAAVEEASAEVTFVLGSVAEDLWQLVKRLLAPMFELFDFFELGDSVYEDIVNKFVAGDIT
ncbi:MAG: hypothetical protein KY395_02335 [Actinobacteria bacterium]|nr:hypothetical protein [Actinomycetota bacterium]